MVPEKKRVYNDMSSCGVTRFSAEYQTNFSMPVIAIACCKTFAVLVNRDLFTTRSIGRVRSVNSICYFAEERNNTKSL